MTQPCGGNDNGEPLKTPKTIAGKTSNGGRNEMAIIYWDYPAFSVGGLLRNYLMAVTYSDQILRDMVNVVYNAPQ
jgi:hypothetical protein